MEIKFPCACGHSIEDHTTEYKEEMGFTWNNIVSECHHDKAIFKGMCCCSRFEQMTNLEYLEYLFEKKSSLLNR